MKTLAELKRTLEVGTKAKLTFAKVKFSAVGIERTISRKQSNGVFWQDEAHKATGRKGSFMDFPKADLFEGTSNGWILYEVDRETGNKIKSLEYELVK